MRQVLPRHRFDAVLLMVRKSEPQPEMDPERSLYACMTGKEERNPIVVYAYDLYLELSHRAVLDAFLLADTDRAAISKVLGIPTDVLDTYEYLFFDVSVFRNRLEKISYASTYSKDMYATELLKTGVMVGSDYLIWTYGGRGSADTRDIVRYTMVDAFYRGMAHRGNSLTSRTAKEAQKWWATAIKNADMLDRMEPQATKQAYEELRIALEGSDTTIPVEKAPVPLEDIMH